jgi:hypothetical protein
MTDEELRPFYNEFQRRKTREWRGTKKAEKAEKAATAAARPPMVARRGNPAAV